MGPVWVVDQWHGTAPWHSALCHQVVSGLCASAAEPHCHAECHFSSSLLKWQTWQHTHTHVLHSLIWQKPRRHFFYLLKKKNVLKIKNIYLKNICCNICLYIVILQILQKVLSVEHRDEGGGGSRDDDDGGPGSCPEGIFYFFFQQNNRDEKNSNIFQHCGQWM